MGTKSAAYMRGYRAGGGGYHGNAVGRASELAQTIRNAGYNIIRTSSNGAGMLVEDAKGRHYQISSYAGRFAGDRARFEVRYLSSGGTRNVYTQDDVMKILHRR